jgi:hypothetical protein
MRAGWIASMLAIACEFGSSTGTPGDDESGTAGGDAATAESDGATQTPGPTSAGPGGDDDDADDDAVDDGGTSGGCSDAGECAPMLRPLRYENPCTGSMTRACPWANFCVMANEATDSATFEGEPGVVYDVTLRARGVVSQIFVVGGETEGHFNVGGQPMPTNPFHPVRLDVSDPPGTYFFNAGPDQAEYTVPIDEMHVVPIAAGAQLTLGHYDTSNCSPRNADPGGMPVALPDIEDPAQPYDGQFFRVELQAAAPRR